MGDDVKRQSKIDGVSITGLTQITDARGAVFHVIKSSSMTFKSFGEAYFSKVNFNVIKGWKYHKKMTQNFSVPYGRIKLVLYDMRPSSNTYGTIEEIYLDPSDNYVRVTIPPCILYSFKGISKSYSLLLNIADIEHDSFESESIDLFDNHIPYKWS